MSCETDGVSSFPLISARGHFGRFGVFKEFNEIKFDLFYRLARAIA